MEKIISNMNLRARSNPLLSICLLLGLCFVLSIIIKNFLLLAFIYVLLGIGVWKLLEYTEEVVIMSEAVVQKDLLTNEIAVLAQASSAVTNGEVGAKIPKDLTGDAGKIAANIESLIEATHQIVREIDSMSDSSAQASRELEMITTSTSRVMTDLSATLEELTSTTVELNGNVADIAAGAKEIDSFTVKGMQQLDTLDVKMGQIRDESTLASNKIMELSTAATKMESVISVISGIAKQTNLLALNAAIEAARAGESGRGFAVVADEVRKLATNTQESLADIQNLINIFLDASHATVKIINANSRDIVAGSGILTETTKSFKVIAEKINAMVEKVQDSSEATSQIASGSQEIASAAAIQSESITEIHNLSKTLSLMSTEMKDSLTNIQIGSSGLELDLVEFDATYKQITEENKRAIKEELNIDNKYVIGMIARLEPNKGHAFFFESLKEVLKVYPDAVVVIAGNGSLENKIERLVEEAGISNQVRLLGYRNDILTILSILDLVVVTSIVEGTPPRIVLEAMAARKPLISTDVVGTKAIMKNAKHGILVKHGDVQKLAESMIKLIKNPEIANNFASEARKHIETVYYGLKG
jgi:methyl-accepting chemotaxis protein